MIKIYKYVPFLERLRLINFIAVLLLFSYDIINGGPIFWGWNVGILFTLIMLIDVPVVNQNIGETYEENLKYFKKRTLLNIVQFFIAIITGIMSFIVVTYAVYGIKELQINPQLVKNAMFCLRGFDTLPFMIFFGLWYLMYSTILESP